MLKRKPVQSFITAHSKMVALPLHIVFFPHLLRQLNYLDLRHYVTSHINERPVQFPKPPHGYTNSIGNLLVYTPTLGAFNGHIVAHNYSRSNWDNHARIRTRSLQRLKAFFQYLKSKIF